MEKLSIVLTKNNIPLVRKAFKAGIELSGASRATSTYDNKKSDVIKSAFESVNNLFNTSKEIPIILANMQGASGFYIQLALRKTLESSINGENRIFDGKKWEKIESSLILNALQNLSNSNGITFVLRLFESFGNKKTKNKNKEIDLKVKM